MAVQQSIIKLQTRGRGFYKLDDEVAEFVRRADVTTGICNLFIQHTSASLLINENADPDVRTDLETFMSDLVVDGDPRFIHTAEGSDDMPAHIRSALTQTSLSIPIVMGKLGLGTWQSIYLWEHRHSPHLRKIILTLSS